jgi:hypothetical protein
MPRRRRLAEEFGALAFGGTGDEDETFGLGEGAVDGFGGSGGGFRAKRVLAGVGLPGGKSMNRNLR